MKKNKVTYIPMYQISRMTIGIIAANSRYIDIMLVVTVSFFTVFSCRKSFLRSNLIPQTCYKRLFYCYYVKLVCMSECKLFGYKIKNNYEKI